MSRPLSQSHLTWAAQLSLSPLLTVLRSLSALHSLSAAMSRVSHSIRTLQLEKFIIPSMEASSSGVPSSPSRPIGKATETTQHFTSKRVTSYGSKDEQIALALLSHLSAESRRLRQKEFRWDVVEQFYFGKGFRDSFSPSLNEKDFPHFDGVVTFLQHNGHLSFHTKSGIISLRDGVPADVAHQMGSSLAHTLDRDGVIVSNVFFIKY
jgi:hypothetical protein